MFNVNNTFNEHNKVRDSSSPRHPCFGTYFLLFSRFFSVDLLFRLLKWAPRVTAISAEKANASSRLLLNRLRSRKRTWVLLQLYKLDLQLTRTNRSEKYCNSRVLCCTERGEGARSPLEGDVAWARGSPSSNNLLSAIFLLCRLLARCFVWGIYC